MLVTEIIYAYTRAQALKDGEQVDANKGKFGKISREHYKFPVYMTRGVYGLIETAVNNEKYCNDWRGVWHDILWMSHSQFAKSLDNSTMLFKVIITGCGRKQYHQMIAQCGPIDIDNPDSCITIMLPEEL
ncbi:MAG: hypothetical protein GY765_15110 [bacterium]|nr:hypothetical protein [bacterium]